MRCYRYGYSRMKGNCSRNNANAERVGGGKEAPNVTLTHGRLGMFVCSLPAGCNLHGFPFSSSCELTQSTCLHISFPISTKSRSSCSDVPFSSTSKPKIGSGTREVTWVAAYTMTVRSFLQPAVSLQYGRSLSPLSIDL